MKKIFRQCRLALLAFLLILPVPLCLAAPQTMSVDEIKPGMEGIAKTVVSGTKLEEFSVEVLGIMKNKGPSGDLILIRTYGDVINRTGGIAKGMSGSPVYIDNKLVGAIAYGLPSADQKIAMVTPIGDMLKLWDMPDKYNGSTLGIQQTSSAEQLATPLMVSGFSEHALAMLQDKLKPLNLIPYDVGETPEGVEFGSLEPGSALGVQLVRGDVSVAALGTVTYAEGDKILAFGHPFLKKGNIGYFITNAYVFTTVTSSDSPFKMGTTGEAIGLINQDRGAGVAGQVGRYPVIIPMRVIVKDNNTGKTEDVGVQVVKDEQLASALTASTMFNVIDKAMDRVGPGTAKVSFEITGRNMPVEIIKRENMFYSPASISEAAVGEFFDAISMLIGNQYNPVDIMDIKVSVTVDEEQRTANIIEAQANSLTGRPGQKLDIVVKLKPFRGETISRTIPYVIPSDQPEGTLTLEVRGGGTVPLLQLLSKRQSLDEELMLLTKPKERNRSFADVVNEFITRDRNNDIVVETLDMDMGDVAGISKLNKNSSDSKKQEKMKSRIATDYIIGGDTQIVINVVK